MPTSERSCASLRPSAGSTSPSISIVPDSMVSSRLMVRHNVDLPEPDGPSTTIDLAAVDVEVDVLQHVKVAEVLVDALDRDHRQSTPWVLTLPRERAACLQLVNPPN